MFSFKRLEFDFFCSNRLFLIFWNLAFLIDFTENWKWPYAVASGVFGCVVPLFVRNLKWAFLFALMPIEAWLILRFPLLSNHLNFVMISNFFLILLVFLQRSDEMSLAAPKLLVFSLGIVYIWAGIHKMNLDFLNPGSSCATMLLDRFSNRVFGWAFNSRHYVGKFSLALVFCFEIVVGIGFLFFRTRLLAVVAGLLFHAFFSPLGFLNFSSVALAVFIAVIYERVSGHFEKSALVRCALIYLFVQFLVSVFSGLIKFIDLNLKMFHNVQIILYLIFVFFLVALVLWCLRKSVLPSLPPSRDFSWNLVSCSYLFVIILFGAQNYIGLSTAGTFSMFSNLRTEGSGWNHLWIPRTVKVFNYQDQIHWTNQGGRFFGAVNLEVDRVYPSDLEKERFMKDAVTRDPLKTYSGFERKLFHFRNVTEFSSPNECRW